MFFNFVSPLSAFLKQVYEYYYKPQEVRFITINMGGKNHNPFEYIFDTRFNSSFKNYKTILSGLKKKLF